MVNPNVQLILDNKIEELRGVLLKFLTCVDIVEKSRSHNLDVLRRQP